MLLQKINKQPMRMENGFNDLFDEIMNLPTSFTNNWSNLTKAPKTNISNSENGFEIAIEIPGFEKDEVSIELKQNQLTISGSKSNESNQEDKNFSLKEFSTSSFYRNFKLPEGIDEKSIKADLTNGILKVNLPKSKELKEKENGKIIKIS